MLISMYFFFPKPLVLSPHIYIIKESPLKYLDTSFFHVHSSPLHKCLGMTLILSTNHKWSWKHNRFLVKLINTDKQKMLQVTPWDAFLAWNANPVNWIITRFPFLAFIVSFDKINHVAAELALCFVLFLGIDLLCQSGSMVSVHTLNLQKKCDTLKI